MEIITSSSNKIAKHVRALISSKKARDEAGAFVVEGEKFVGEIPAGWDVELTMVSESYAKANGTRQDCYIASDSVFASVSDVKQPQGVLCIVRQKEYGLDELLVNENPLLILLEDMQDPGNLGTVLRIAHGLGACGVVLSPSCADVYSPKAVRSSAGSVFHVPFVMADLPNAIAVLKDRGIHVFATKADARQGLHELDFCKPSAFLVGNEARGLSENIAALADCDVKIPIKAESLNASMACGILVYEAMRQRGL